MPSLGFKLDLGKLEAKLREAAPKIRREVVKEMYLFGEEVMTDSKKVVPVKTGNLMNTGHVECAELGIGDGGAQPFSFGLKAQNDNEALVVLGYGGPAAGYALYVHEALEGAQAPSENWSWTKAAAAGKEIKWTRPGSGPKYLETPLKAKQDQLPGRLREAALRALK